ncbi:MAG: ATP-binding cassette domain-containing protein [Clostridia bacterium]|nr:ATP-binding cassette domain-containing protein [Clostridia bacterium]
MIEFRHVTKEYEDGTVAVHNFNLVCESHETTVLVGTSGSGKTTVMRMVNRMVDPTCGQVIWDGVDVATMDAVKLRRSIGYVIQEGGLFPHWTVAENIATVLRLEETPKGKVREAVFDLMDRTGLPRTFADRYPGQLSGGQRQRVGVARALANKPLLMLMDEPFGALDPLVRRDLQNEMIRIRDEFGVTILLVTHDMSEAMRLGQKVVVMQEGGDIVQAGRPQEILERPATPFVSDLIEAARF